MPIKQVEEFLRSQGLGNLAEKIIEEIKVVGTYENSGKLLPS